jgi:hypothetical protein
MNLILKFFNFPVPTTEKGTELKEFSKTCKFLHRIDDEKSQILRKAPKIIVKLRPLVSQPILLDNDIYHTVTLISLNITQQIFPLYTDTDKYLCGIENNNLIIKTALLLTNVISFEQNSAHTNDKLLSKRPILVSPVSVCSGVYLASVYLASVHLVSVYLTSVHLVSVYLASVHQVSVHLASVYLSSVYLASVHLASVYLESIYLESLFHNLMPFIIATAYLHNKKSFSCFNPGNKILQDCHLFGIFSSAHPYSFNMNFINRDLGSSKPKVKLKEIYQWWLLRDNQDSFHENIMLVIEG